LVICVPRMVICVLEQWSFAYPAWSFAYLESVAYMSIVATVAHTCEKCRKQFRDSVDLRRHLSSKRPCKPAELIHKCDACGRTYSNRQNLNRHRREGRCVTVTLDREVVEKKPASPPRVAEKSFGSSASSQVVVQNFTHTVQNIHVNTLGHHQQVTVAPSNQIGGPTTVSSSSTANSGDGATTIGAIPGAPERLPGWPDKWPVPAVVPTTFKPLGFEISQPELEAAVGSLTEAERASCARGDTLGVSRLLVEILKRVHSDPRERNVYLNPRRADQALVFIPSSWSAQPLEEASQSMFARVRKLLDSAERSTEQRTESAVEGARRGCASGLPQLARASRSQLSAHLENVRRATASGEDWLGTGGDPSDQPSFIGKEMAGHLTPTMLIPALEQAAGVYSPQDINEGTAPGQASRALAECARYILHSNSENLTILPAGGEVVYAHEHEAGWAVWPREKAAEALLRRAAAVVEAKMKWIPETPLAGLRPWLRERLVETLGSREGRSAGERVVTHYAAAAVRYYSSLPRVNDPHDRKEAARRILQGEAPCPHPPLELATGSLSADDLEELLGFAV